MHEIKRKASVPKIPEVLCSRSHDPTQKRKSWIKNVGKYRTKYKEGTE
jgi:hypothetical protein